MDTLRAEIRRAGETFPLRRKSFDVLVYLLRRPRRIVTKTEILDAVWGNRIVTEGSLKSCLTEIRAAIGDPERKLIRTVPGRGYMLEAPFEREAPSILVAPIDDQTTDGDSAYIADGLTEEIIIELSKIESFRVISHASAMRLKGMGEALQETARELGVDYVLGGSIRRRGDKLRVTLRLSDLDTSNALWIERYDGSLVDLFDMHDEIAQAVAEELAQQVPRPKPVITEKLEDPRAVESYLRARYQMWRFSEAGLQQAEQHLRNGLDLVGPNTRLLETLGHVYARYSEIGLDSNAEFLKKARRCAEQIFELDPDSSRGYALLGIVQLHSGALRAAKEPLERSLRANPTDPDALVTLGYLYALIGRNEHALRLFAEALAIDPLTPINHCMPGFVALMEGRNSDALTHYRKFFKMDPYNAFAAWSLGYVLLRNGKVDEASEVIDELKRNHPDSIMAQLADAILSGVCGKQACDVITDGLRAAARNSELLSREITHSLALAGETDEALDWLENTVRIGNINYPFWAQHNEWVDSIRSNSRFDAIMRDVEREWLSVTSIG
ncbi:MAG: winged helix-turn-helix domain-containing protein [Woeseiaceae bacterium]|nr:winged helix-turn-helix domain-containing protein [Woeseiaceae bacterium]